MKIRHALLRPLVAAALVTTASMAVVSSPAHAAPFPCEPGYTYDVTSVDYEELVQLVPTMRVHNNGGTTGTVSAHFDVTGTLEEAFTITGGVGGSVDVKILEIGVQGSVSFTVSASLSVSIGGEASVEVEGGMDGYVYGGIGRVVTHGRYRYVDQFCTVLSDTEVIAKTPISPVWSICGETKTVSCNTSGDPLRLQTRGSLAGAAVRNAAVSPNVTTPDFGSYYWPLQGGTGGGGGGGGGGGSSVKAEPALAYDQQDGHMKIYRWLSDGDSFTRTTDYQSGSFSLSNVGDRVAAGDVDGDGDDDIVMAYQNSDNTFGFHVFTNGKAWDGIWYTSGPFSLGPVAGRLVVADFTGDGRAEPALVRDDGDGTMTIWRWQSTGSSFTRLPDYHSGPFSLANVGNRVATGDVNGDGRADIVIAYQIADGTFGFYVFEGGNDSQGRWYTSGAFNLSSVAGRLVVDDFNGDGKAEPALARDNGSTMTIYRWLSTGSSFTHTTDYTSGTFDLANVGDRVASGDVTGDGKADIVMAYQYGDGTWGYYVFPNGSSSAGIWYTGGQFNMNNVVGRLVVGAF